MEAACTPPPPSTPTMVHTRVAATSEISTMGEVMVSGDSVDMIVGVVVGLVLLILVTLVVIIPTLLLLKRRRMLRQMEPSGNQACAANPIIPVEPNLCYGTTPSVDPDQLYATVEEEHQQQDMELTENQAYTVTPNILVEPMQPVLCHHNSI